MKFESKELTKFILLSILGIFLFFTPIQGASVPIVVLINFVSKTLGKNFLFLVVFISGIGLNITVLLGKTFKIEPFKTWHKNLGKVQIVMYVISLISYICIFFSIGSENSIFNNVHIGGEVKNVAPAIFTTIFFAGWFIYFLLKSGFVEFVGVLIEPIMKPIFKLPGIAGLDALSSFVVSPAVATNISAEYYREGVYTRKEAIGAATCFSTCSVGFIFVMSNLGGVPEMSGIMTISTFLITLLMTIIMMRIPIISNYENIYIDGSTTGKVVAKSNKTILNRAVAEGIKKSKEFSFRHFLISILSAAKFAILIVTFMSAIVMITLTIVYHTSFFDIIGKPFEYIFSLLGLENADLISSAPVLTFPSLTLPVSAMAGLEIASKSRFFVTLLSITQILFMSETGTALMNSDMKVTFKDIIILFIIRTVILIPIVALVSHLVY
ncbi:MAG: YjiH family protein [Lachnospirales bacterium]